MKRNKEKMNEGLEKYGSVYYVDPTHIETNPEKKEYVYKSRDEIIKQSLTIVHGMIETLLYVFETDSRMPKTQVREHGNAIMFQLVDLLGSYVKDENMANDLRLVWSWVAMTTSKDYAHLIGNINQARADRNLAIAKMVASKSRIEKYLMG